MSVVAALLPVAAWLPVTDFAQLPSYEPKYGQSGIDLGAIDTNVSPCSNFYQYACGTWRVKNPIPPDRARWSRFDELTEKNLELERGILEKAAQPTPTRSALDQKIGDFYAAFINEPAIERLGIAPIESELDQIRVLRGCRQHGREPQHCKHRSGRHQPARPRLLPQDRSGFSRSPYEVSAACGADVWAVGDLAPR
jgi:hypothetical protein